MALIHSYSNSGAICTLRINDPPSPREMERRNNEGLLPYPTRLSYRLVIPPNTSHSSSENKIEQFQVENRRTQRSRIVNERDQRRQSGYNGLLRSHHVPLVPFTTFKKKQDGPQPVPSVEELTVLQGKQQGFIGGEEYTMCQGFHPNSEKYLHRYHREKSNLMLRKPILQLERMFPLEVVPSPPREISFTDQQAILASI